MNNKLPPPSQQNRRSVFNREFINMINNLLKKIIPEHTRLYHFFCMTVLAITAPYRLRNRKTLRLDVSLTGHCNLNCSGCYAFSPLSNESYLEKETYMKDLSRLLELTKGSMEDICLLGGEPLLHPEINEICQITREYFPNTKISILTNGILLPSRTQEFWDVCRDSHIKVSITKYPIKLDIAKIREIAQKNNVDLNILYEDDERVFYCIPYDIYGNQNRKRSFKFCIGANRCIHLWDGKLSCPPVAYIEHFNKTFNLNLERTKDDYIDLYKIADMQDIFDFFKKPIPFCRYCNSRGIRFGIRWRKSTKALEEWT